MRLGSIGHISRLLNEILNLCLGVHTWYDRQAKSQARGAYELLGLGRNKVVPLKEFSVESFTEKICDPCQKRRCWNKEMEKLSPSDRKVSTWLLLLNTQEPHFFAHHAMFYRFTLYEQYFPPSFSSQSHQLRDLYGLFRHILSVETTVRYGLVQYILNPEFCLLYANSTW